MMANVMQKSFKHIPLDVLNAWTHLAHKPAHVTANSFRVAVKDNIAVKGMPLTCGSSTLLDNVAQEDAQVIKTLRDSISDLFIVGKTNMDEFGMGSSGSTSCFGPTLHPFQPEKWSPGGSSAGTAVAVKVQGRVDVGIGTDTGGSVRLPAACTGCIGFKPSRNTLSTQGIIPYAPSMDSVGLMAMSFPKVSFCRNLTLARMYTSSFVALAKVFVGSLG